MQDLQQSQNIPPYTQTDLTQTLLSVTHNILLMTIFIIDQHGTTNNNKILPNYIFEHFQAGHHN